MRKRHETVSRFLSLILRHDPARIGLALDRHGWAIVADLLARATQHGTPLTVDVLREVVAGNDEQRFAFSDDGLRIRANQGHSLASVDLDLPAETPPDVLYHGTASRFVTAIRQAGLKPGARKHVHLSADTRTAISVGTRYGVPVVLTVRARQMHDAGHVFCRAANGVWLTDAVPARYIDFPVSTR